MTNTPSFSVGSTIYLKSADREDEGFFEARVIGYVEDRSLIISQPQQGDIPIQVSCGDRIIIRCLAEENVYAFESTVQQVCEQPFAYLLLDYPTGIQGLMLRRGHRVDLSRADRPQLRLAMTDGDEHISVSMADISLSGARLTSDQRLGNINDKFSIDMQVLGVGDPITLPCIIRYVRSEPVGDGEFVVHHHGVEFKEMDQDAQLFISRFIRDHVEQQRQH